MALIGSNGRAVCEKDAPKIEFPCENYPVKVVGKGTEEYQSVVLSIFDQHAAGYDVSKIQVRNSNKGNFQSLTIYITATGEPQLAALHKSLSDHPLVHMVI